MPVGNWDPKLEQGKYEVDTQTLKRFISFADNKQLDQVQKLLSPHEQQVYGAMMKLHPDSWTSKAEHFSDAEITSLMRFFTVAENLPGWESGDKSPVIWLGKVLKQRGTGISRDLVLWIKNHSNNQYLPHGPIS